MVMNQDRLTARAEAVKFARTGLRPPTHRGAVPDGRHGYEPGRQVRCELKIVQLVFGLARYGIGCGPENQFKFCAFPRAPVHAPTTPRSEENTTEIPSLMRYLSAAFRLNKKK